MSLIQFIAYFINLKQSYLVKAGHVSLDWNRKVIMSGKGSLHFNQSKINEAVVLGNFTVTNSDILKTMSDGCYLSVGHIKNKSITRHPARQQAIGMVMWNVLWRYMRPLNARGWTLSLALNRIDYLHSLCLFHPGFSLAEKDAPSQAPV